jgi:hypothetical protein
MLAEHVQPNLLIIILERTDYACFSKQPLGGCTQNKIYKKAWSASTGASRLLKKPASTKKVEVQAKVEIKRV